MLRLETMAGYQGVAGDTKSPELARATDRRLLQGPARRRSCGGRLWLPGVRSRQDWGGGGAAADGGGTRSATPVRAAYYTAALPEQLRRKCSAPKSDRRLPKHAPNPILTCHSRVTDACTAPLHGCPARRRAARACTPASATDTRLPAPAHCGPGDAHRGTTPPPANGSRRFHNRSGQWELEMPLFNTC